MTQFHITVPAKKTYGYWVEVHSPLSDISMLDIDAWVTEHNLGKRMAYNMWKLKNSSARNWFILKWG